MESQTDPMHGIYPSCMIHHNQLTYCDKLTKYCFVETICSLASKPRADIVIAINYSYRREHQRRQESIIPLALHL